MSHPKIFCCVLIVSQPSEQVSSISLGNKNWMINCDQEINYESTRPLFSIMLSILDENEEICVRICPTFAAI